MYEILAGKILVRKTFNSFAKAEEWAKWNYDIKGHIGGWKVVELPYSFPKEKTRKRGRSLYFGVKDFKRMKRLQKEGINAMGIAKITGWSISTIKSYLSYTEVPNYLIVREQKGGNSSKP